MGLQQHYANSCSMLRRVQGIPTVQCVSQLCWALSLTQCSATVDSSELHSFRLPFRAAGSTAQLQVAAPAVEHTASAG